MTPHKCPICDGRGLVPLGFYAHPEDQEVLKSIIRRDESCRSCGGSGVLWNPSGRNTVTGKIPTRIAELEPSLRELFPSGCFQSYS